MSTGDLYMEQINLEEYKKFLVNNYKHEYDNNEYQKNIRTDLLKNKYKNEYLESIIVGTYNFIQKIFEISDNNYFGYIEIALENEPCITYIDLGLIGGWMSDTVVKDSDNNFYSVGLLRKIFGPFFDIEPCKIEFIEQSEGDEDFLILSEIPLYYLYIQCKKEIIDNTKMKSNDNNKKEKTLRITKM